ncbi:MAG: hypothetical protein ACRYG5_07705, partial [Janthinobacterium lividum]
MNGEKARKALRGARVEGRLLCAASLLVLASQGVQAAPLDALLSADLPGGADQRYAAELAGDYAAPVFGAEGSGGTSLRYLGGHLSGTYRLTPWTLVSADYWRRELRYGADDNGINSWQVAIQRILHEDQHYALAARFSVWGDTANTLQRDANVTVLGFNANHVAIHDPNDLQVQFNLIGSVRADAHNRFNGFVGAGGSKVSIDSVAARVQSGACALNIAANESTTSAALVAPCANAGATLSQLRVNASSGALGLDFDKTFDYRAAYLQAGGSWDWQSGRFNTHVAYRFQYTWRSDVDTTLESMGSNPVHAEHELLAQLSYDLNRHVALFVR